MTRVANTAKRQRTRQRGDSSDTRQRLLTAAEQLMREQGYAAVTSRRLGQQSGVTATLVHYYFASMDDLFVSLYRQHAETTLARVRQALDTQQVPQVLWALNSDPIDGVLHVEFMALSNHRPAVREAMANYGEVYRKIQHNALKKYLKNNGIEPAMDPDLMITLMASTGLLLSLEQASGMTFGHRKTRRFIAELIDSLEA
ncbi:TetR/AcrR family transcriptional regulator [Mangrovimicrobium sediminis]|uniref:TetR/AcrR family transcriptional regulator n=1 Tax=Mangrovimicrobium sediminis TaxID=2562682 RepID=A0A4Z0LV95_9GAMM|nr:TetR/AcrR family transcriptional regulator [Haliea sp. SAOS-164]TGD71323.1 TetR/AcrR family transcriptional regulator [Haliea sp. SAOS-164]